MKVIIDFVRHLRGISKNVTCQINVVWLTFLLLGAIFHSIGGLENQNVSKLIHSIIALHFSAYILYFIRVFEILIIKFIRRQIQKYLLL